VDQLSIPPSVSRARERAIGRMVKDFTSFLRESVSSVLDDGCPFSEFKPALLMYLSNISSVTNADFIEPYHSQLRRVERDLRERERLLTLNLEEVASAQVETMVAEREKFVTWAAEESTSLLGKVIFLQACKHNLEDERAAARTIVQAQIETIAMANRVIADAQALLVKTKGEYELMMKRLDDLEAEEQGQIVDIQAREGEIDKMNTQVDEVLSVSEEELHRIALDDAL